MERETYKKLCKDCRKEILGERATELFDKLWQDTDEFTVVMREDNKNQNLHVHPNQDVIATMLLGYGVSDALKYELSDTANELYNEFGVALLYWDQNNRDEYVKYLKGAGLW